MVTFKLTIEEARELADYLDATNPAIASSTRINHAIRLRELADKEEGDS